MGPLGLPSRPPRNKSRQFLMASNRCSRARPIGNYLVQIYATKSEDLLRLGGIEVSGVTPGDAWNTAYRRNSDDYLNPGKRLQDPEFWQHGNSAMLVDKGLVNPQRGVEYGHDPRGQAAKLDRNAINNGRILTFREGKRVR